MVPTPQSASTAVSGLSDYSDVPVVDSPIGTYISLYAGAGGLDLGFALAGFAPVWVSELEPFALATHEKAFERLANERPHLKDLHYKSVVGRRSVGPSGERLCRPRHRGSSVPGI